MIWIKSFIKALAVLIAVWGLVFVAVLFETNVGTGTGVLFLLSSGVVAIWTVLFKLKEDLK